MSYKGQDSSDIQYHIEIRDAAVDGAAEGEIMLVLDLGSQEISENVAQTIVRELSQSGAAFDMGQDVTAMVQSAVTGGEVVSQERDPGTHALEDVVHQETEQVPCLPAAEQMPVAHNQQTGDVSVNYEPIGHKVVEKGGEEVGQLIRSSDDPMVKESEASVKHQVQEGSMVHVEGRSPSVVDNSIKVTQARKSSVVSNTAPSDLKTESAGDIHLNETKNAAVKVESASSVEEDREMGQQTDNSTVQNSELFISESGTCTAPIQLVLSCSLCDFRAFSDVELGQHRSEVHQLEKPFHCHQCGKDFVKELSLQIHAMTHEKSKLKTCRKSLFHCPLCSFDCRLNKKLVEHFEQEHARFGPEKLYSCALCKFSCLSSVDFAQHTETVKHLRNLASLQVCPRCSKACLNLEQHMQSAHSEDRPYLCSQCGYRAKARGTLKAHMLTHIEKKDFVCPTCQARFKSSVHLNRHMKLHDPLKKFSCPQCSYSTNSRHECARHFERVHTKKPVYSCKFCEQSFVRMNDLKYHCMSVHGSKDFHYCKDCDFSCVSRAEYRTHRQLHTDKNRYCCTECGFSTRWKCHLVRHQQYVHSGIKNKPHVCQVCGYSTFERLNLKKHMVVHSSEKPFSCNLCDYKCKLKQMLTVHQRVVHSDLRPYSCDQCKYTAKSSHNLKKHMWIHEKYKPFKCPYCPHECREKNKLRRHMEKKHKNEVFVEIQEVSYSVPQEVQVLQVYTNQRSKEVTLDLAGLPVQVEADF